MTPWQAADAEKHVFLMDHEDGSGIAGGDGGSTGGGVAINSD